MWAIHPTIQFVILMYSCMRKCVSLTLCATNHYVDSGLYAIDETMVLPADLARSRPTRALLRGEGTAPVGGLAVLALPCLREQAGSYGAVCLGNDDGIDPAHCVGAYVDDQLA